MLQAPLFSFSRSREKVFSQLHINEIKLYSNLPCENYFHISHFYIIYKRTNETREQYRIEYTRITVQNFYFPSSQVPGSHR